MLNQANAEAVEKFHIGLLISQNSLMKITPSAGPKGGGQKGHMPPRIDRESYLAPGKKMKNMKRHAKNWYKCESNTCAFTECKNGRTLVKYGNLRLLIRDQTTPHCDARNSKCQIEPWGVRRNLTPYAVSKDMSSCNKFQCHQTKTNIFVYTPRMFHKIYFVWHWPLPCSEYL